MAVTIIAIIFTLFALMVNKSGHALFYFNCEFNYYELSIRPLVSILGHRSIFCKIIIVNLEVLILYVYGNCLIYKVIWKSHRSYLKEIHNLSHGDHMTNTNYQ